MVHLSTFIAFFSQAMRILFPILTWVDRIFPSIFQDTESSSLNESPTKVGKQGEIAGVVEGAKDETMAPPEYGEKLARSRLTNYSTRDPRRTSRRHPMVMYTGGGSSLAFYRVNSAAT